MTKRLKWIILLLLVTVRIDFARDPISHGKPTELTVIRYERFIASGALLTHRGWSAAANLFDQSIPYPENSDILLSSTGGAVGEMSLKDGQAEVETKWTDDFGRIDSTLRYIPPRYPGATMTAYQFQPVFTNKHRDIGSQGETIREVTGPWKWKLVGPLKYRSTVPHAIEYVAKKRDESDSPQIRKNAERTITTLGRLRYGCGAPSAC